MNWIKKPSSLDNGYIERSICGVDLSMCTLKMFGICFVVIK